MPPGEYPIVYRIIEEIRCADGTFETTEYDTVYVYDMLTVGTFGCPMPCDVNADGAIDILDVVLVVSAAFRSEPAASHPCNAMPADLNCDTAVDVLDAVGIVNAAFRHGPCPGC
jgi:hypothetical protein